MREAFSHCCWSSPASWAQTALPTLPWPPPHMDWEEEAPRHPAPNHESLVRVCPTGGGGGEQENQGRQATYQPPNCAIRLTNKFSIARLHVFAHLNLPNANPASLIIHSPRRRPLNFPNRLSEVLEDRNHKSRNFKPRPPPDLVSVLSLRLSGLGVWFGRCRDEGLRQGLPCSLRGHAS
jgi:hypothetical protein